MRAGGGAASLRTDSGQPIHRGGRSRSCRRCHRGRLDGPLCEGAPTQPRLDAKTRPRSPRDQRGSDDLHRGARIAPARRSRSTGWPKSRAVDGILARFRWGNSSAHPHPPVSPGSSGSARSQHLAAGGKLEQFLVKARSQCPEIEAFIADFDQRAHAHYDVLMAADAERRTGRRARLPRRGLDSGSQSRY